MIRTVYWCPIAETWQELDDPWCAWTGWDHPLHRLRKRVLDVCTQCQVARFVWADPHVCAPIDLSIGPALRRRVQRYTLTALPKETL